jgi:serine/threonine-protein kinase
MGIVVEAVHARLGQRVAIKVLDPTRLRQPSAVRRFEREARAAARIQHPNVVRITDVDETADGAPYYVMERLVGVDLGEELRRRGSLPFPEAVDLVVQAAAGVAAAHRAGIVHRDLKPSNLYLCDGDDAGPRTIKVLDFGISKIDGDDARITATDASLGTPRYMSPEQIRSAHDAGIPSAVWSLGVILYELIAGRPPFDGTAAAVIAAITADDPPPLAQLRPEIPEALSDAIDRALAKDPSRRHPSAVDFAHAITRACASPAIVTDVAATVTTRGWDAPPRAPRLRRMLPWIGGASLLAVAGAIAALATRGSGTPNAATAASVSAAAMAPAASATASVTATSMAPAPTSSASPPPLPPTPVTARAARPASDRAAPPSPRGATTATPARERDDDDPNPMHL